VAAATPPLAPSGEQIEISLGDQRAIVVEVGGGLRSYVAHGRELLDSYDAAEMSTSGRGQVLIPWPNRIEDGSYEFDGTRHQLSLSDPEEQDAIHGLVRWASWRVAEREASWVVMEHVLHPQPGYPFSLRLRIEYVLGANGLRVRTTATNLGSSACPYGSGAHPYLTVGTPTVDPVFLCVPAATVLLSNERGIPVGLLPVAGTPLDFRVGKQIDDIRLDNAFTDLARDEDGLARVELRHPHDQLVVTLWLDESYRYVMLFTGDPLPDVNRRSVAVEPMTCPPNAFRSGDGLIRLEPGASTTSMWGITPS
jgi:aldose 1-epimerase